MIVWHVTKRHEDFESIKRSMIILLGKNVVSKKPYAHISTKPFVPGGWALDIIGADTNEAWVLELEIDPATELLADPADNCGEVYGGGWMVSKDPIRILHIKTITHIPNVRAWESHELEV